MVNANARNLFDLMQLYRSKMKKAVGTKELNLNAMHIQCMRLIQEAHHCTANAIGQGLDRDKSQISLVVKDMAKKGWIEFLPNPQDKRSKLIELTSLGESLLAKVATEETLVGDIMKQGLSAKEIELFDKVVLAMKHNLKNS
ncbi:MarR family winged helix-turn-helix transcriptional regulator [Photobacterium chitinilyticum]|uniref:MarR family transcriptional regulator n=1 Tax=Photobacterium chitinilyticum TaxID=2485123 RepID=A0A3S3R272_9GAMM|nr:MarR family transcriptional regulator [Photobacterium chitinilyticum]RWX56406.1 MarR family transcriptional regulator [Photobacterium chitinilyticum]